MSIHEIILHNYDAQLVPEKYFLRLGTKESYGLEQLHVTLQEGWEEMTAVTVTFTTSESSTTVLLGSDGIVNVPPEATAKATEGGCFKIVFKGVKEGAQRISTEVLYKVENHAPADGDNTIEPTPDQYAQFIAALDTAVDAALTEAKESGEFDGAPGTDGFSPIVAVEDIDGGHRVTITDKDGDKTFDVMDGKDGSGGGASSWNDLTDKPFYEVDAFEPIYWDGSTEGRDIIDGTALGLGVAYKISDHAITVDELAKMKNVNYKQRHYGHQYFENGDWHPLYIRYQEDDLGEYWSEYWMVEDLIYVQHLNTGGSTDIVASLIYVYQSGNFEGIEIPSVGTYILWQAKYNDGFRIIPPKIVHPIDRKYLPSVVSINEIPMLCEWVFPLLEIGQVATYSFASDEVTDEMRNMARKGVGKVKIKDQEVTFLLTDTGADGYIGTGTYLSNFTSNTALGKFEDGYIYRQLVIEVNLMVNGGCTLYAIG